MLDVQRLEPAGWERLRDLRLRALTDAPEAFGSTIDRERAFAQEEWHRRLGLGPWWVAVASGDDVGVVAGGTNEGTDVPWVYSMWVDPAWRGSGAADLLIDRVIEWARLGGATRLGLDVTDQVPRARRFYERVGFKVHGESFPLQRDPAIQLVAMFLDL